MRLEATEFRVEREVGIARRKDLALPDGGTEDSIGVEFKMRVEIGLGLA